MMPLRRELTGRRRRGLALLVLCFFLAAVGLLSLRVIHALATPPDALEQKVVSAGRYLYYRVSAEQGPRFELTGDEHTLRFVSHALVPTGAYDPAREVVYGLRLEVVADGKPLWSHDVYARSRQSKARHVPDHGGLWLDENAFSLQPGVEVTDDRQMIVQLPGDVPAGAELRLRLVGEPKEAVVRVYAEVERSSRRRRIRLRRLSPADREAIADKVSYVPWDRLADVERLARLRRASNRLPAMGKEGVDYETRVLYYSGFRLGAPDDAPERGLVVTPARAAAINVKGPAQLTLMLERPAAAAADQTPQTLELRSVGEGAQPEPYAVDVPGGDRRVLHAVSVGAGVHTLELSTTAPLGVHIELTGPAETVAGLAGGSPGGAISPDAQLLPGYLSGPDGAPVIVAVSGPDDFLGRAFRIDVRLIDDGTAVPLTGTLYLQTTDDTGRILAEAEVSVSSVRSRFEELRLHGQKSAMVSEPVSLRFVVPRGGRQLRLRSSRPAMLRISAPMLLSPPPDVLDPPFAEVPLVTHVWRYARFVSHNWQPLRALDHDALAPERTVKLATQARLEPAPTPEPPRLVAALALAPDGQPERQTVLERVAPDDAARVLANWNQGDYARLVPGQGLRLDFSQAPSRPKIQYWVTGDADDVLGQNVELLVDGETVARERFVTTHGSWKLPRGLRGVHHLTVRTRAAAVRLLVDRPPVGGGELYALRTIYAMDRPLRVRVGKGAEPENLDLVVYSRDPAADPTTSFTVTIDGGAPRRVEGVALERWTLAERSLDLPAADRDATLGFANVAERGRLYPRLLVVSLGDDLPAGSHTVEVRTHGGSARWARFFVLSGHARLRDQAIQWRISGEGGGE